MPIHHLIGRTRIHFVKGANGYLHPGGKTQAQIQYKNRLPRLHAAQKAQSAGTVHVHRDAFPIGEHFKRQNGNNGKYINDHVLTNMTRRSKSSLFTHLGAEAKATGVLVQVGHAHLMWSGGSKLYGEGIYKVILLI